MTLRVNRQHQFVVRRPSWIEVVLLDSDGEPIADEPVKLTLSDDSVREETLNGDGELRLDPVPGGECTVEFPNRQELQRDDLDVQPLEVELVDADGKPVAGEPYRLTLPNGDIREGKLDDAGKLSLDRVPAGECRIEFPDREPEVLELISSL